MQGLDPQRVAYLGSASKSLSPALRLGWMALPDDLVEPVIAAAGGQQFYVNSIDQLTMADFIRCGQYDKHIRRMRNSYRRRRDALVERLRPFDVRHERAVRRPAPVVAAARRHRARGVATRGRGGHRAVGAVAAATSDTPARTCPSGDGVVVNFGAPAEHAFGPAVDALCGVLAGVGGPRLRAVNRA